ncbi:hypothetical protein VB780_01000 [Leptolyngbya sp. CCNP1308]|uniref:hypothetical protein n=1 Tax=Leptolyngbya sp. CCNP1308 TaxID=3110255 RepID=UPI002B1FA9A2|nr:hypothetical protein [Leptolyngbya sp. CCNP1308]MEA5447127.1 hypothetical protein [Leptolyngbya sp. CCNP1308]
MGRPSNWSGPTRAIRVPEHLAEHLLTIARQLDNPEPANNVQNPSGLPICKPKADAETIAQGLAEGWIVPKAAPLPPYLLTSTSPKGTYRYTVHPPPDIPAEVWAEADRLIDEVCGQMSQKEHWLMLGRLVEEWGQKVDG